MTDHGFELRLRADLRELAGTPAPATLRASVISIPDEVPTSLRSRLIPELRVPAVLRFVTLSVAVAAAALVIALIGIGLFVRPPDVGPAPGPTPTPTIQPTPDAASSPTPRPSPAPSLSRFTSTMHGLSIDYPTGWQTRPATEPWTGGELTFDSPAADVIFDPILGDGLYLLLASKARAGATEGGLFPDLIRESGVCDPEGGFGGASRGMDGVHAWAQDCSPGIRGATSVKVTAAGTGSRDYVIVLVRSSDAPGFGQIDYSETIDTVDLPPK